MITSFTGHRPEKLPGKGKFYSSETRMLKSSLAFEIENSINDGCRTFYTGLARGVDLWAAEFVINAARRYEGLKLFGVKPFNRHGENFDGEWGAVYQTVIANCVEIITTSENYHQAAYAVRNRYLIEHSQRLIAVVSEYNSGTGQTIRFAQEKGIEIREIFYENKNFRTIITERNDFPQLKFEN